MKKKLTIYSILLICLMILVISVVSYEKNYSVYKNRVQSDLYKQAVLMNDMLEDIEELDKLIEMVQYYSKTLNVRVTIINESGKVIADSDKDPSNMDNHFNRPEIKSAYLSGYGSFTRYSDTLKTDYLYVAILFKGKALENGVIRLSVPLSDIQNLGLEILKLSLISILVGAVCVIFLLYIYINKLTEPLDDLTKAAITISKGNYNIPLIVNGDEQINKLVDAFEDMRSELKKNMSKLKRRNNELELILRSIANGIVSVDKNMEIMFCNDVFKELFEIKEDNVIDRTIFELIRNSKLYDLIDEVLKENKTINRDIEYGQNSIYRITANPMYTEKRSIGALVIVQDISTIKKLENMRRDFVSNVTHELKTPLTSIRGFIETLKNGAIRDEAVAFRFLDIIDIEAERLYGLIHDILSLSEIENSNSDVNIQKVQMADIIDEVCLMLKQKAEDKNLDLTREIDEVPAFVCNRNRIKQLLINLLDNALKYTEKGSVNIKLQKKFNNLLVIVEDTGIGIPEDALERIFERFYRVDKGRSRKMGGTGLGLSIVKHIVELYDGTIKVESRINEGTKFIIQLPYKND